MEWTLDKRAEASEQAFAKKKIFVVDDDENLGRSLVRLLNRIGYECEHFQSALELLARLREELPDLILLDVRMSWISGMDLMRGLRRNPKYKKIPVVMITGFASGETRFQAFKMGADAFLEKPFENDELISVISQVIQKRS